ncbi:MAG TPA: DNA mismatch repair endonuclease MutL [Bryobacteraceae bacterium]|nr:DNA mismatch repair endonuclease MutL [Bryobacteraceae bacterium]
MGRIRVLPDAVANQIAAGEVVERPASVIKELLENSLDAGATSIVIEAESGGRRLLRITDNGCGMLRDDAMLAFERHATSKLSSVKDLLSIATLGFRGEALPSIASVSRLTLETHAPEESTGACVEIHGGKMIRCDEAALATGTVITVRDLFFNVPARKKFLRSDQTELAHIASLVTHYSLAHPDKTFALRHDNRELLHVTPVATLRERVFQVFGSHILEDLLDIGEHERELLIPEAPQGVAGEERTRVFLLRGFVSRPQVQKYNRNSIYLFVNGRLIRDKLLMHALQSAYHNLMPPGSFPFALLFLDCDAEEVDVNVHPSKTEVRFRHGSWVHDYVRDSIRDSLMQSRPVSSLPLPAAPQAAARLPYSEFSQQMESAAFRSVLPPEDAPPVNPADLPVFQLHQPPQAAPRFEFTEPPPMPPQAEPSPVTAAPLRTRIPDTHGGLPDGVILDPAQSLDVLKDLRPLGQLHESFILAAGRDGLWIIDQHVAHERILFEQVLRQRAAGRVEQQTLLMPMVIELTAAQQIEYAQIADELRASGFESEPFGNRTIAISSAPAAVKPGDIEKIVFEILETAERELRGATLDEVRRNVCATIACRAAIKINMRLDQQKMEWLLAELARCEHPTNCPHGRPIALRYSTRDILKGFHRI